MKKQTLAIHTPYARRDAYDALSMPIYHSVAYEFDDAETMSEAFQNKIKAPDYSRTENPTVTHFERKVRFLTHATHVTAFNSGMAAISNTLFAVAQQGKTIVTSRHLFGNTSALLQHTLARLGISTRFCDLTNIEEVESAVDESVCCIFLEIMTNPQLEVANLSELARIAHRHGIPLIADSTIIPFTQHSLQQLGVDIEVVSSTKYISGGATSLGGLIIDYGNFPEFNERVKYELLFNLGAYMTPQAAYMQALGLETLDARYRIQAENTLTLARRLKEKGLNVNYVGLPDNPFYELSQRQFGTTAGAMLTIDLADREACFLFINQLRLIRRATNLFDNKTLAIHPASTIFGNFTEQQRKEMDVRETTIRISVGLEDVEDILEDIVQAM